MIAHGARATSAAATAQGEQPQRTSLQVLMHTPTVPRASSKLCRVPPLPFFFFLHISSLPSAVVTMYRTRAQKVGRYMTMAACFRDLLVVTAHYVVEVRERRTRPINTTAPLRCQCDVLTWTCCCFCIPTSTMATLLIDRFFGAIRRAI